MPSTTESQLSEKKSPRVAEQKLDSSLKVNLAKIANTIRELAMDATQKADSGHPGLPMGCAEIGAYLYGYALHHNPKHPHWVARDRFVLSAGHGSMLLYACLYFSGFGLTLDDIKQFRQLHSKTPGHPESLDTVGVESTTGPLGQGVGNGVGQALGLKILADQFNSERFPLFNNKVFILAGDGCMMEGVSSEASSLAGHLKIDNLILIYDANNVSLDGPLSQCCSEDTKLRYQAYGWDVFEIDGHDFDAIHSTISHLRKKQEKPSLIIARTIIGKGSPNKAGTHKAHGSPLGEEEVKKTKELLGLPMEPFYIPPSIKDFFDQKLIRDACIEERWQELFSSWGKTYPEKLEKFHKMEKKTLPPDLEERLRKIEIKSPIAGRKASHIVIDSLADWLPFLYGGSADLSSSDFTMMEKYGLITPAIFNGRNIKYGVREFAMATMATGLYQTGMIIPFIGTFLTFSDYMRNAIRLAALQEAHVIYQFTHDSIFLGEDGPTHQPIEHYAALRAIPKLQFIRPADANEVKMAWIAALNFEGPTAFALTRQNLPAVEGTNVPYKDGMGRGAYIIRKEKETPDFTLVATGSEVSLAVDVADELQRLGKSVRIISMPCWEIFEKQSKEYKVSIFGGNLGKRVSIEAGVELGWHKYIGSDGIAISIEQFGASAPLRDLKEAFGFTVPAIINRLFAPN